MLAPLEPLDLPEGSEVEVAVSSLETPVGGGEAIRATSGAWANLLDCDAFERSLYERRHRQRAAVRL